MVCFWLHDPKILFREYDSFWPMKNSSRESQYNSLTRFFIYSGILLSVYKKDPKMMGIALIIVAAIATLAYIKKVKCEPPPHPVPKVEIKEQPEIQEKCEDVLQARSFDKFDQSNSAQVEMTAQRFYW